MQPVQILTTRIAGIEIAGVARAGLHSYIRPPHRFDPPGGVESDDIKIEGGQLLNGGRTATSSALWCIAVVNRPSFTAPLIAAPGQ